MQSGKHFIPTPSLMHASCSLSLSPPSLSHYNTHSPTVPAAHAAFPLSLCQCHMCGGSKASTFPCTCTHTHASIRRIQTLGSPEKSQISTDPSNGLSQGDRETERERGMMTGELKGSGNKEELQLMRVNLRKTFVWKMMKAFKA